MPGFGFGIFSAGKRELDLVLKGSGLANDARILLGEGYAGRSWSADCQIRRRKRWG